MKSQCVSGNKNQMIKNSNIYLATLYIHSMKNFCQSIPKNMYTLFVLKKLSNYLLCEILKIHIHQTANYWLQNNNGIK